MQPWILQVDAIKVDLEAIRQQQVSVVAMHERSKNLVRRQDVHQAQQQLEVRRGECGWGDGGRCGT